MVCSKRPFSFAFGANLEAKITIKFGEHDSILSIVRLELNSGLKFCLSESASAFVQRESAPVVSTISWFVSNRASCGAEQSNCEVSIPQFQRRETLLELNLCLLCWSETLITHVV